MSWYQKRDCDDKYQVHILHKQLLYDKLDKIQATRFKRRQIDIINIKIKENFYNTNR